MARAETRRIVWWVEHPDHTVAVVIAPDWELATVEAAKWWEVPWRTVAAQCSCQRRETLPKYVCADCGDVFYGLDGGKRVRCRRCESLAEAREASIAAAGRRYWKEMQPRQRENLRWCGADDGSRTN